MSNTISASWAAMQTAKDVWNTVRKSGSDKDKAIAESNYRRAAMMYANEVGLLPGRSAPPKLAAPVTAAKPAVSAPIVKAAPAPIDARPPVADKPLDKPIVDKPASDPPSKPAKTSKR
jgi:hypothetical protein